MRAGGRGAQTAAIQKRRGLPKSQSPAKAKAIDPTGSRLLTEERKKHKQELEKARRSEINARKGAERAEEKLRKVQRESQAAIKEAKERCERTLEELRKVKGRLEGEIKRLSCARSHLKPFKV